MNEEEGVGGGWVWGVGGGLRGRLKDLRHLITAQNKLVVVLKLLSLHCSFHSSDILFQ